MSTGRLETFADGVFAIAATLLILSVDSHFGSCAPVGATLAHQLECSWPSYVAYVVSFLTIGIIWVNHHTVMEQIDHADRTFLMITVGFLMVVAFIPFPTKLVADHLQNPGEHAAVYAYDLTLLAMAVLYNVWWRYARRGRRLIAESVPQSKLDAISRAFDPGIVLYLVVLAVAFVNPLASVILTLILAAFYVPAGALFYRATG